MTTLAALAAVLAATFTAGVRDNGQGYTKQKEGTPEWAIDIVREAHGGMMPNDMSYNLILGVVNDIEEVLRYNDESDLDDLRHERIDSLIPVYNTHRVAWLASDLARGDFVDEALENMGGQLGHADGIYSLIALGIDVELNMIWAAVENGLRARQDELADA